MDIHSIQSVLETLSKSNLDKSEFDMKNLAFLEDKVVRNLQKINSLDTSNLIAAFFRLGHVPKLLIADLDQQVALNFNKQSVLMILEVLVQSNYKERDSFYDKLLDKLKKHSVLGFPAKFSFRSLKILLGYSKIYPQKDLRAEAQYYLNKFNDSTVHTEGMAETDIIF